MRNSPAPYKHADQTHLDFGKSGDSSLLAKQRRNYDDGGGVGEEEIDPVTSMPVSRSAPTPIAKPAPQARQAKIPTAQNYTPEGYRPGLQARQAEKYPGWPTMSVDPAWENRRVKSAQERINPDWGTAI